MPTFNFIARFVDKIDGGTKGGTIRNYRKRPMRVGQMMFLSTGSRFKPVRIKAVPCVELWDIQIEEKCITLISDFSFGLQLYLDTKTELDAFARCDGFEDFKDMKSFWEGKLPWRGFHARWIPLKDQIPVKY